MEFSCLPSSAPLSSLHALTNLFFPVSIFGVPLSLRSSLLPAHYYCTSNQFTVPTHCKQPTSLLPAATMESVDCSCSFRDVCLVFHFVPMHSRFSSFCKISFYRSGVVLFITNYKKSGKRDGHILFLSKDIINHSSSSLSLSLSLSHLSFNKEGRKGRKRGKEGRRRKRERKKTKERRKDKVVAVGGYRRGSSTGERWRTC